VCAPHRPLASTIRYWCICAPRNISATGPSKADARAGPDLFADADITREEYVGRKRALIASLNAGLPQPTYSEAVLVRAARLLSDLGDLWAKATPTERAEIVAGLFAEVRVRDDSIVAATPARDEYRLLIASAASRDQVSVARPEGSEHSLPSIVIEGVEELVNALRVA
jgi:hypothetical protein